MRGLSAVTIISLVGIAVTSAVADNGATSRTLHLRVGAVDTRVAPNLLDAQAPARTFAANQAYVLQLPDAIRPEQRQALASAGVQLGAYLPDHAYIARLDRVTADTLSSLGFVAWVGEYQNAWKLDPAIGQRLEPFQTPERRALEAAGQIQAAVTLFEWSDVAASKDALVDAGFDVQIDEMVGDQGMMGIVLDNTRLAELAALPFVQYIEESAEITLRNSTTRWIVQSNTLNVTPLYDNGLHGEGQVVAVVDGRVDVDHCSFDDTQPIGPLHRKILAYNASDGSDDHGTHVAGTAVGDNGVDDHTRGIAYLGKLVYDTVPSFTEVAINNVLTTHHNQGARLHTNSWGDDGTTAYNGLARGFDLFQHNNEESLCLLAVTNTSTLRNPENAKNLLAVGASQDTPSQNNHCSGGVGPTADGRRKPEIYAPGCSTNSSRWNTTCSTIAFTGTSMACPAVAGTAMLVRQYYADGYYPDGAANAPDAFTPSAALIKATLLNSTADMTGITGYPSNLEGWGRVLADDALFFPGDTRNLLVLADVFNVSGLSTGQMTEYPFSVSSSSESLRVTMVFTDAPGTSGSSTPVVNNLDLELTDPSGAVVYKGNVFSGGVSTTGGSADALNNVEQILINSPATGLWSAKVLGTAVNQSTQGYALVATGDVNLGPLPPTAEDLSLETPVDTPILVQLDAFDVDNDPLEFKIIALPSAGTLVDPQAATINTVPYTLANSGSQVQFVPQAGFVGTIEFNYAADDGGVPPDGGQSNTALVTILVKAAAPVILTTSLPDGAIGVPYGPEQLQYSGGQPPLTWQIVADVPYVESDLGTNGFAETGVAQGWHGDDFFWDYTLPFEFPFYDTLYTEVRVVNNGMLNFGPFTGSSYANSDALLIDNRRIAPLWDDLKTTGAGEDIFIDTSDVGAVTIRWKASTYSGATDVNVAVTLHQDGAIDFHYGSDNAPITPTIGVSDGDGSRYTLSGYNNAGDLGSVNSIRLKKPDQLSPGLTMDTAGVLSGTPAQAGAFLPVFRVTDSLNRSDEAAIPLTILITLFGDFDLDGDVDVDDLIRFTECLAGPMSPPPAIGPPPTEGDCLTAFDSDASTRIDLVDFAALQEVVTP